MIKLTFKPITLKEQIEEIAFFFTGEFNNFRTDVANHFGFDENKLVSSDYDTKLKLIKRNLSTVWKTESIKLAENSKHFQALWEKNEKFINDEITKIFGREFTLNCTARLNLNIVCPRDIENKLFDIYYCFNDERILQVSAHEIVHFVWFEMWKKVFPRIKKSSYNYPNLPWLLSELSIDPIFYYSKLKKLSNSHPAYDYFYKEKYRGAPVLEYFRKLYKENSLTDYMKLAYKFLKENKDLIKVLIR